MDNSHINRNAMFEQNLVAEVRLDAALIVLHSAVTTVAAIVFTGFVVVLVVAEAVSLIPRRLASLVVRVEALALKTKS